jgi:hypothetical protein
VVAVGEGFVPDPVTVICSACCAAEGDARNARLAAKRARTVRRTRGICLSGVQRVNVQPLSAIKTSPMPTQGKSLLFLKKKKQKDFYSWCLHDFTSIIPNGCAGGKTKVFLLLFLQKKKTLSSLTMTPPQ